MNRLAWILSVTAACFSGSVLADDAESASTNSSGANGSGPNGSGFYLGAGLSGDHLTACVNTSTSSSNCSNTFTSNSQQAANLRLIGGYAFGRHFAVEGGLSNYGTYDVQDFFGATVGNAKASSINIAAKGTITFPRGWSIFGKAGLARTRMHYSAKPCCILLMSADQTSGGLLLGAGGQYDFSEAMAVRLWTELVTYKDDGYTGVVGGTTLAALFKF